MVKVLILTECDTASYSLLSGEFNSGKSNASTLFSELCRSHKNQPHITVILDKKYIRTWLQTISHTGKHTFQIKDLFWSNALSHTFTIILFKVHHKSTNARGKYLSQVNKNDTITSWDLFQSFIIDFELVYLQV